MGLFTSGKPAEEPSTPTQTEASHPGQPQKKAVPTPTRKAAEAARRERLNPTLSPKEAKRRDRAAAEAERRKQYTSQDATPQRLLMRDLVDSRFNLAEFAMPILLGVLALSLVPAAYQWITIGMYITWGYLGAMAVDLGLMWRTYKRLAAERLPGVPLKGMLFYGFNRQMSFRRWRTPAPRVKRGEQV